MLTIKNLHCRTEDLPILKGLNLEVKPGEIHAIMGPNGAGKSTLSKVLSGHPEYEITEGVLQFEGEDILDLEPEERTAKGIFASFQYPVEIPGVSNKQFLHMAHSSIAKAKGERELSAEEFNKLLEEKMNLLQMNAKFASRSVNESFSGGEKKRNEILQLAILQPKLAILDETDSGLDIDAMRTVAKGVKELHTKEQGLILITHYQRLLDYIPPDVVHVLWGGRIIKTGGPELALKLEEEGYDWLSEEGSLA